MKHIHNLHQSIHRRWLCSKTKRTACLFLMNFSWPCEAYRAVGMLKIAQGLLSFWWSTQASLPSNEKEKYSPSGKCWMDRVLGLIDCGSLYSFARIPPRGSFMVKSGRSSSPFELLSSIYTGCFRNNAHIMRFFWSALSEQGFRRTLIFWVTSLYPTPHGSPIHLVLSAENFTSDYLAADSPFSWSKLCRCGIFLLPDI